MAPINPPTYLQAGTYSARLDRLSQAGLLHADPGAGALAVRGGVRPTSSNTGLQVTQRASPGMFVTVAAGSAVVPAESAVGGCYVVHNDASYDVAVATSHSTLARRDLVVARVRDAEYSGVDDAWELSIVTGTPAGSPVLPSTPSGAVRLAQVQVNAGVSTITNANITDLRRYTTALGGTVPCPTSDRPSSPYEGMGIYDTTTDTPLWWNGSAWHGYGDEGYLTTSELASYLSSNGYVTTSDLTAAGYLTQTGLDAIAWTAYTPTWGASITNPSLGNGAITGRYMRFGKLVTVQLHLNIGSSTNKGTGFYTFTCPITPKNGFTGSDIFGAGVGVALFNDVNAEGDNNPMGGQSFLWNSGSGGSPDWRIRMMRDDSTVSNTYPISWATGDDIHVMLTYEAG